MLAIDSDGFLFRLYKRPTIILRTSVRGIPALEFGIVLLIMVIGIADKDHAVEV